MSVQRAIYQSLPKDKKKLHPLVNTITQTDDYLQFIEKLNSKNVKPVEEAKKEEIKEVDSKSVRTDSMDEPSTQIASVENSPDKKNNHHRQMLLLKSQPLKEKNRVIIMI